MKILYLTRDNPTIHFNHWFTIDLILALQKNSQVKTVKFYGPNLHIQYPNQIVCQYNKRLDFLDLKHLYDFNIIILGNMRRLHSDFKLAHSWLPNNFKTVNAIKVCIESDYHQHKLNHFYQCGINTIFHRHLNTTIRAKQELPQLKHVYLPFSVDMSVFYPKNLNRIPSFCFAGHDERRGAAVSLLKEANLLNFSGLVFEQDYIDILQKYIGYLCHSSSYNIDNAKAFEIIASGGILFTNQCSNNFKQLFGESSYVTYTRDYRDLLPKAKLILSNKVFRQECIQSGLNAIKTKHTHDIRCQELVSILKTL
jgi:hypothetical protein